ncbi:hypothetical protein [Spiroplasma endosymbiont of Amphimallon solstitiale]|uniref:hypothetical protein n=1 Tax=Spiroplasma endosymbiont of Amphimallon solstitiale TaxID=3066288 RepID=UPI00313CDD3B
MPNILPPNLLKVRLKVKLGFFLSSGDVCLLWKNLLIFSPPFYIVLYRWEFYFNYVEKYGWPKIIHQFTLKILFLIKNLLKVTLFSVKIL